MFRTFFIFLITVSVLRNSYGFRCDRRPYGAVTQASKPDGRFKLRVLDTEESYLPDQLYTVQLTATDEDSQFVSFVISAEGDLKPDPRNPRRLISLFPGEIRPQSQTTARFSDRCLYSVEQASSSAKESVEVYWQAPSSGSGCVTLRAMVAESEELWFEDGGPLTRKICEDLRQPDDVSPTLNSECSICGEAKYEVSFTGIWSRNTHPRLYPENDWVPKYSDLVGASHAAEYILWTPGMLASEGLRDLAEHANSSQLEGEILTKIGAGVRTLIKGKGHGYRKMNSPTYSIFRVDKTNHLISTAVAIHPSPDWFLGITRFELCQVDNTWLEERELNLFPWDAGTDSGVSYESPNMATFPQDAISRVELSSYDKNSPFYEMDMKDMHPFGKLHIKLVRVYHRECPETTENPDGEEPKKEDEEPEQSSEPAEPSRYQNTHLASGSRGGEAPLVTDPDAPKDCPITPWSKWSPCDGDCEDGKLQGYRWRERYHLVDGIAVEKYDPDATEIHKEVPEHCKLTYHDFEREECEDTCTEYGTSASAQRRIMPSEPSPIEPGQTWTKKRDLVKKTDLKQ